METPTENPTDPWLCHPGETDRDFARFERFRLMSPTRRSVNAVWVSEQTEVGVPDSDIKKAHGKFYERARHWDWEPRDERLVRNALHSQCEIAQETVKPSSVAS